MYGTLKMKTFLILCALMICLAEGNYNYHHGAQGWLKLFRGPATWKDAYLNCYYEGAVLASPENRIVRGALIQTINTYQSINKLRIPGVFTGVHASFGKRGFFSVEGTPLVSIPRDWAPREPDNADNSEDCLFMARNGSLADVKCSDLSPYICCKKKQKDMALNDCKTVNSGYTYDNRTGSCYRFHKDLLKWTRAFVDCAHDGSHFAVINRKTDEQLTVKLYNKMDPSLVAGNNNRDIIFLGFTSLEGHYLWMTVHGKALKEAGVDEWAEGQPDSVFQHCGVMFKERKLDSTCSDVFPFVCETVVYFKN